MSGSKSGGFSVSITAVDNATAAIDRVNKRIAAISAPAERFNKAVGKLGDVSGVNRLGQGMQNLAGRSLDVFRSMDRIVPALGGITGAASLAGMATLVQRWGQLGQQVANAGQRLGIPTDRLTALQGAARLAGSSAEDLTAGLGSLDEKLRGATFRGDSTAIQTFKALGVNFGKIGTKARNAGDAFGDVADGIARIYNQGGPGQNRGGALKAAQNLGLESLFPLLVKGKQGIADLSAEAAKLGVVISPDQAKRAEELRTSFTQVGMAAEGLGNNIADKLSKPVQDFNEKLAKWISNNSDLIGTDVAGWVNKLGEALKNLDGTKLDILLGAAIGYKLGGIRGALVGAAGGLVYGTSTGPGGIPVDPAMTEPSAPFSWWHPSTWFGGGTGGAGTGEVVPSQHPHPVASGSAAFGEQQREHDFWKSKGLTEAQIAGPLANVAAESQFNPTAWNEDHTSYGLYQMTGPRLRALQARFHTDEPTADQQRAFAWDELQGAEHATLEALRAAKTRAEAGRAFTGFERPKGQDQRAQERANAATLFAAPYPDSPVSPEPSTSSPASVAAATPTPASVAAAPAKVDGTVKVDVHLHGATDGTTAKATSTGQAEASPPRIAMPLWGIGGF